MVGHPKLSACRQFLLHVSWTVCASLAAADPTFDEAEIASTAQMD